MADFWGEHGVPPVCSGGLWAAWPRQEGNKAGVYWCAELWVICAHGKVTILGVPWLSSHGRGKERTLVQTSWKNQGQGSQGVLGNNQTDSKEAQSPKVAATHSIIITLSKALISHHLGQPPSFQKHAKKPFFTFGMWIPVTAFWLNVLVVIEWEFPDISLSSIMSFISETPWL